MLREEYTGEECGKCDENEHNPFVLVLPLLTSAKKMRVFLLVFAFVRKIVRARVALALVKEVITERERLVQFPGQTTDQNVVIPYTPPFVSLERRW